MHETLENLLGCGVAPLHAYRVDVVQIGAPELDVLGMAKYGIKNPIFKPSPVTPNYKDYLIFEGISVDEGGKQEARYADL